MSSLLSATSLRACVDRGLTLDSAKLQKSEVSKKKKKLPSPFHTPSPSEVRSIDITGYGSSGRAGGEEGRPVQPAADDVVWIVVRDGQGTVAFEFEFEFWPEI